MLASKGNHEPPPPSSYWEASSKLISDCSWGSSFSVINPLSNFVTSIIRNELINGVDSVTNEYSEKSSFGKPSRWMLGPLTLHAAYPAVKLTSVQGWFQLLNSVRFWAFQEPWTSSHPCLPFYFASGLSFGQGASVTRLLHESLRWNSVACGRGHFTAGPDFSTPSNSPSSSKKKPQPPRYSLLSSLLSFPSGRVRFRALFFVRSQTNFWVSNDDPIISCPFLSTPAISLGS